MRDPLVNRAELLQTLTELISQVQTVYQNLLQPDRMVYEDWSAKDVLAHILFWHESFARNVQDLGQGVKPTPLKGKLADLNQQGVEERRIYSVEALLNQLAAAQTIIREHILKPEIEQIPYKKGSRDYTPEEHLELVIQHVSQHLADVSRLR